MTVFLWQVMIASMFQFVEDGKREENRNANHSRTSADQRPHPSPRRINSVGRNHQQILILDGYRTDTAASGGERETTYNAPAFMSYGFMR